MGHENTRHGGRARTTKDPRGGTPWRGILGPRGRRFSRRSLADCPLVAGNLQEAWYRRSQGQAPPGRPRKLNSRQERTVLTWFLKSPRSFGFPTDLWTAKRVAQVIERKWKVKFNSRYLNAWLAARDITPQKPQRISREADQDAIEKWRTHDWPRLQNGRAANGPLLFSLTNAGSC